MQRIFAAIAWLLLLLIVVLSFVPADYRPITPIPHGLEHAAIFILTGLAFGLGSTRRRYWMEIAGLVAFSAAIEIVQLGIPGRHARLHDFLVDAVSASIGVCLAFLVSRRKRDA
jgi:VanZ family protein